MGFGLLIQVASIVVLYFTSNNPKLYFLYSFYIIFVAIFLTVHQADFFKALIISIQGSDNRQKQIVGIKNLLFLFITVTLIYFFSQYYMNNSIDNSEFILYTASILATSFSFDTSIIEDINPTQSN